MAEIEFSIVCSQCGAKTAPRRASISRLRQDKSYSPVMLTIEEIILKAGWTPVRRRQFGFELLCPDCDTAAPPPEYTPAELAARERHYLTKQPINTTASED